MVDRTLFDQLMIRYDTFFFYHMRDFKIQFQDMDVRHFDLINSTACKSQHVFLTNTQ